jgi:hypothetical protein
MVEENRIMRIQVLSTTVCQHPAAEVRGSQVTGCSVTMPHEGNDDKQQ